MEYLTMSCQYLLRINISQCDKLSEESLFHITNNCDNIVELNLAYCKAAVTDESISQLFNLRKLSVLDISYCENITDAGLQQAEGTRCRFLKLYINGLDYITDIGIIAILSGSVSVIKHFEMTMLNKVRIIS